MSFWNDTAGWSYDIACTLCGNGLKPHRLMHDYQTRRLSPDLTEIHWDDSNVVGALCSEACATELEELVTEGLDAKALYPPMASLVPCAECGRDVDRLQPHIVLVSLPVAVEEGFASPIGDDLGKEIAAFCASCKPTQPAESASADLDESQTVEQEIALMTENI